MKDNRQLETNKKKPLVTCIITCYKKFDYLYEAILSALEQNYPRIELLVTDDGSEFFPQEKVEKFIEENKNSNIERYLVYHHEKNVGTVKNINNMLKIANGDYFIGLDGDDVFYSSEVMSKIVKRFEELKVDFLSCSRVRCTQDDLNEIEVLPNADSLIRIKKLKSAKRQFKSFVVFQYYDIASGSAMYYSRDNLKQMGLFDESYRQWQDGPRITEYVHRGKMIPTAFDIIAVKYRDGGVSNNPKGNSTSASHLGKDKEEYIRTVLIPNKKGTNIVQRRKFMFWYYWDVSQTNLERIKIMCLYPEKGASIVWRKICGKKIR